MKFFNICALGATLCLPSLASTAQAQDNLATNEAAATNAAEEEEESLAEHFIVKGFAIMAEFAEIAEAVVDGKTSPAEAAQAIAAINVEMAELYELLPTMSEDDKAELAIYMENEDIIASEKEACEGLSIILSAFNEIEYYDCPELKAACDEFAELFDIELQTPEQTTTNNQ